MRVVQINGGVFGSTGKIMFGISDCAKEMVEMQMLCASPVTSTNRNNEPDSDYLKLGTYRSRQLNVLLSRITGFNGCFAVVMTHRLLKKLARVKPDLIHLHVLHDSYLNLPMLFRFIKKHRIPVVWTMHDCWAFTGHCPHFTMVKCDKWRTGCHHCPQYREYPQSLIDNSRVMYRLKKQWFSSVENMTIVTPSQWLADLVKQSFLKDYPVKVIHNGIDLAVFKPSTGNFRAKFGIPAEKKILLGVAFGWGVRKGLDVFVELAQRLDPERYQIVLVGTNDKVDRELPDNIISIHRTNNQQELADIYTEADLFLNPTREEVLGLVNVEALACGLPVLTFKTGGAPECIDETCGVAVDCDDLDSMEREIHRMCSANSYAAQHCVNRAKQFDYIQTSREYIALYQRKIEEGKKWGST